MKTAILKIENGEVLLVVSEERGGKTLANGGVIGGDIGTQIKKLLELYYERIDFDFKNETKTSQG